MEKYFITFNCSCGSLAVEKYLYEYARRVYENTTVVECRIEEIVKDLRQKSWSYAEDHKNSKSVSVTSSRNHCTNGWIIGIGSMYMVLVPIKREFN